MRYSIIITAFALVLSSSCSQEVKTYRFGSGKSRKNATTLSAPVRYQNADGYGFDFGHWDRVVIEAGEKPGSGYCTSEVPFYFSIRISEGSYDVGVNIGNPNTESVTTIKAEARRVMLFNHPLQKGETEWIRFNVNVRNPVIGGTDSIRLKPREYNYMNWDDRLTLEFSGRNQAVRQITIRPVKKVTNLYLAGNSTVTDQDHEPWASWGQMITPYFDRQVVVANFAESGESLASFKSSGRLRKVLSLIQPGDYLFIEFGHNDQKRKGEGIGPWTSFSDLLVEFTDRARENGAIPIFLTPTQRRSFDDSGRIALTHGDYPAAMRKVAEELEVPLIDLHAMTRVLYETWGGETSKKAFVHYPAGTFPGQTSVLEDNTHFNAFGAHEIAWCVLKGIMDLDLPLKRHILNFDGQYDPARPSDPDNWVLPESPRYISKRPEGN